MTPRELESMRLQFAARAARQRVHNELEDLADGVAALIAEADVLRSAAVTLLSRLSSGATVTAADLSVLMDALDLADKHRGVAVTEFGRRQPVLQEGAPT